MSLYNILMFAIFKIPLWDIHPNVFRKFAA